VAVCLRCAGKPVTSRKMRSRPGRLQILAGVVLGWAARRAGRAGPCGTYRALRDVPGPAGRGCR